MARHRRRRTAALLLALVGVGVLAVATNRFLLTKKEPKTEALATSVPVAASDTGVSASSSPAAANTPTKTDTKTTSNTAAAVPPATSTASVTVAPTGNKVGLPDNISVVMPNGWVYSNTDEGGVWSFNFGNKQFSQESPYDPAIKEDASGYLGPDSLAPSEAAGPQTDSTTVSLSDSQTIIVKTYSTVVGDNTVDQLMANFTLKGKSYVAVLYTNDANSEQKQRFIELVRSIVSL